MRMNTTAVKTVDGKSYNSSGQQIFDCKTGCGEKTVMDGTKLCDSCWEKQRKKDFWS